MKILNPDLKKRQSILVEVCNDLYFWTPFSITKGGLLEEIRDTSEYIQAGSSGSPVNIYIVVDIETFERITELGHKWIEKPIQKGVRVNIYEGVFGTITFIHPKSLTIFLNNYE